MKKRSVKKELLFPGCLIVLTALLFGGFYEFVSCLVTSGLGICLLWFNYKNKRYTLYWNGALALAAVVAIGYAAALLWAVDRGMALLGFLKYLPLVLFVLVLMQLSAEERRELLFAVPVSGVLIVGIGILLYWIPAVREHLFMAGRFGGTFQYANTMALYFLTGIIVVQGRCRYSAKTAAVSSVLLLGIFMTGSRSVFVITLAAGIIGAWKNRSFRLFDLILLGVATVGGGVYAAVSGDFQNFGRFLTISLESSTLTGRILYWMDAFPLILKHPLGLGYMGYYYSQGQIQTGVYTTLYVHNDLLQAILDIGWVPAILGVWIFVKNLVSKKIDGTAKTVLFVIIIHSLFDFDLQFLSICFVCFLVLNYEDNKESITCGKRKESGSGKGRKRQMVSGVAIGGILISAYFLIPLGAFYAGEYQTARQFYPGHTEAELILLENAQSKEEGEILANSILSRNNNASLAFDAKALASAMENDYDQMVWYKEEAVKNNPYDINEYADYVSLLSRAVEYYYNSHDEERTEYYIGKVLEIPGRLEEIETRTSKLGWRIKDKPELELPEEIKEYIHELSELKSQ